jgi:hypothetical protein
MGDPLGLSAQVGGVSGAERVSPVNRRLSHVGSNPTPATTYSHRSELVPASFPSLSKKRSGQPGALRRVAQFLQVSPPG